MRAVDARKTLFARIMPLIAPCIRTVCATTSPVTEPFTPTINALQRMSPCTTPSTWISPLELRLPSMVRSALMMDGTAFTAAPSARMSCVGTPFGLVLENIGPCLQKLKRVHRTSVIQDFVVHMRARATAAAAQLADHRPSLHDVTLLHQDARHVTVAGHQPVPMIDLNHAPIGAVEISVDNLAFTGRCDRGAHLGAHVEALMLRVGPRERIL